MRARVIIIGVVLLHAVVTASALRTCQGTITYTGANGTLTDGSPEEEYYSNSALCTFVIQPPDATRMAITFTRWNVEATSDTLTIYALLRSTNTWTIVGVIDATPATTPYTYNDAVGLRLVFSTDSSVRGYGWTVLYTSDSPVACGETSLRGVQSGLVGDGSDPSRPLDAGLNCTYALTPLNEGDGMTLQFLRMDVAGSALVSVHAGPWLSSPIVATFANQSSVPASFRVNATTALVHLRTGNGSALGTGFTLRFRSDGESFTAVIAGVCSFLGVLLIAAVVLLLLHRRRMQALRAEIERRKKALHAPLAPTASAAVSAAGASEQRV